MAIPQIKTFFSEYQPKTCRKGEVLIQASDKKPQVFYIEEGTVVQYDIAENGSKVVLNTFKAGAFFPIMFAMADVKNSYFFETRTPAIVRAVPAKDAVNFVKDNPEVAYDLLVRTFKGSAGLLAKLSQLMAGTAGNRLMQEITIMAERFGETDGKDKNRVLIRATASQLATQTGLARETVSRELQKLKAKGVIASAGNGKIALLG